MAKKEEIEWRYTIIHEEIIIGCFLLKYIMKKESDLTRITFLISVWNNFCKLDILR